MPDDARRVLMVAFHYPPVHGSSGLQRTLKFSTYLRGLGWQPIVLTVSPSAYESVSDDQLREVPPDVVVARAFGLNTARDLALRGRYLGALAQPDRWVSWWPAAVWQGLRLVRTHRPQALLSTYPIATAHLIGLTLQRLTRLPWIADFRDSMTEPGYPRDPLTWRTNRRLEAATVRHCARAVFTTEGTRCMYEARYADVVPAGRWAVIENGFDEENFVEAERGLVKRRLGAPGQLTLLHSGVLYPRERDPAPFFEALRALKDAGEASAATLQVRLRASGDEALYARMLQALDIADLVKLEPPLGYRDALREMLCADALLLFQSALCNHQIPAKLYEYFRAGRPIFALTDPAGDTAAALHEAGVHEMANIADARDIERSLRCFLAGLRAGAITGVAPAVAATHSRAAQTGALAQLLSEVVAAARLAPG